MKKDPKKLFNGKNVLIHGLGLNNGGVEIVKYLSQFNCNIRITDLKTKEQLAPSLKKLGDIIKKRNIKLILGEHREEDFKWADIVIRNPAIPVGNKYIQIAKENGAHIFMDISLFFELSDNLIIGITGTKGKSTTSTLIYEILKEYFNKTRQVILAGNIGIPPISFLDKLQKEDIVVLELSSFQLYGMGLNKQSPHIAVLTNMYVDHINWHKTFEHYLDSKLQITKWQTPDDYFILNLDSPNIEIFLKNSKARKIGVTFNGTKAAKYLKSKKVDKVLLYEDNQIFIQELGKDGKLTSKLLIDLNKLVLKLKGTHNLYNILEAIAATVLTDLNVDIDSVKNVLNTFSGAHGRQQFIRTIGQIDIYNDTAATVDVAIAAALDRFGQEYEGNVVYIMGGVDKKIDYSKVLKNIKGKLKAVVLLEGTASEKMKPLLEAQGIEVYGFYGDFKKAVKKAYELASSIAKTIGKDKKVALVLTPGAASFNMFNNEWDRGEQFNELVEQLPNL